MDRALTMAEREACYLARRLNRGGTAQTISKWTTRAHAYQPMVDRLRPLIARFDHSECEAQADRLAVAELTT